MKIFRNPAALCILSLDVLLLTLQSCTKNTLDENVTTDYISFFPLKSGNWYIYNADSIVHHEADDVYNLDTSITAYHFQVKEQIDSSYTDATGKQVYIVLRYRRDDSLSVWTLMNVWTESVDKSSAQRVEDNIRYIKLAFPIDSRSRWNGNAYNNFGDEEYYYDNIFTPGSTGILDFDSTVTVVQNDFSSMVNKIYKAEIYAKYVGMISKQSDSVSTSYLPNGSILILNGTEYRLTLQSYQQ
ncbi:MAG: hypothetical protein IT242_01420 [Bacteroidia bacterium]|nr:hypothetical protein [Bacteroidia bacterium]